MTTSIVRRAGSVRLHRKWWGLIFVLPVVTFFAAFNLFPTLFGLWLSFTDYDLLSPPVWVGLDNFANLFADRLFLQAFRNTLVFVLGATVPVWVLSLLAALVFDQAFRGRDLLKAAFFLPVLPPVVVIAVVWRLLLHSNGVLTSLTGGWWGVTEIRWLADAPYANHLVSPLIRTLAMLGRNSLYVFCVGSLLSLSGQVIRFIYRGSVVVDSAVVVFGIVIMAFTAWLAESRQRARPASPTPSA